MKTKVLLFGLFLLTFVLGIYLIPKTGKEITTKTAELKIDAPKISDEINPLASKDENSDVMSFETAKNFGGSEMLEEKYWEKEKKYKYGLLRTGEFHGDEVSARSGENWLGLFKQNDGFYLSASKINVKRVRDEIVDESENQKTGKKVSVNNKIEPLVLIDTASKLKIGKVKTLFGIANPNDDDENNPSKEFRTETPYNFTLNDKNYSLKVEKVFNAKTEIVYALIFEANETKQILNVSGSDYTGHLYWVGDLDRDNKLDFIIEPYIHDNVLEVSLYLSSEAEKNNLVKKIASMVTSGC